ncbi:MAG: dihydropteroate synthase [Deltaproteobacteria bacterium]|nr:dihydropteroate synthase [Deltaproteobacteria bacterium]
MGVINVTPDSFSDGKDFYAQDSAVAHGLHLVEAGADILDIGGESTRPGARSVSQEEELRRVIPVIESLVRQVTVPLSIDTCKSGVAKAALQAGASMINDISAGRLDPELILVASRAGVPLILMHMQGEPRTMQDNPTYQDLMGEVKSFLVEAAERAENMGLAREMIIIDPGIGFGKTFNHNLTLINRLEEFIALGRPVMVGPSRKAFLGQILGGALPKERDVASAAVIALAAYKGAHILRVHNIDLTRQTLAVVKAVKHEKV